MALRTSSSVPGPGPEPPRTYIRPTVPTYRRHLPARKHVSISRAYLRDEVYPDHPWIHAMMKVKKVIEWRGFGGAKFDQMTGRCWRGGRQRNCLVARLVDLVHKKTRTNLKKFQSPFIEVDQLQLLKERVTTKYTTKAGLHQVSGYKPGICQKEDAKMLMAAAFFVETEPDRLPQDISKRQSTRNLYLSPAKACDRSLEEAKHQNSLEKYKGIETSDGVVKKEDLRSCGSLSPPIIDNIQQAMLKMNEWADDWLTGKLGFTDVAWESFEFCLSMPRLSGRDQNVNPDGRLVKIEASTNDEDGINDRNGLLDVRQLFARKLSGKRSLPTPRHELDCNSAKRIKMSHSPGPRVESNSMHRRYDRRQRSDSPLTFVPFQNSILHRSPKLGGRTVSSVSGNQSSCVAQDVVQSPAAPCSSLKAAEIPAAAAKSPHPFPGRLYLPLTQV